MAKLHIAIDGHIYDVTNFVDKHPGGSELLYSHVGTDATDVFAAFHSEKAYTVLRNLRVHEPSADSHAKILSKCSALRDDMLRLREKLEKQGMFRPRMSYYARHIAINVVILVTSVLMALCCTSLTAVLASAFLMAMFWQQSGWLAHDVVHHSVLRGAHARRMGTRVGEILGNLMQGFSVLWWKHRHNTHHAMPNVITRDPDIDTLPILAWCERDARAARALAAPARAIIGIQAYAFALVASFARLAWAWQSLDYVVQELRRAKRGAKGSGASAAAKRELVFILGHWALYFWLLTRLPPLHALTHALCAQLMCGLLLASVFTLNHSGTVVLAPREAEKLDFFTMQIITGRDLHAHWFTNWFCGGLNFQIEHHLFPTMPRHSYPKIQSEVRKLCARHNVMHHTTSFFGGIAEVLRRLHDMSAVARRDQ